MSEWTKTPEGVGNQVRIDINNGTPSRNLSNESSWLRTTYETERAAQERAAQERKNNGGY